LQDDEENEEEGGLSKSGKELKKLLGRAAGLNESDADEDEEEEEVLIHSLGTLIF
jgi:transcription initiation factor TFIIF subunit alpha